MKKLLGGAGALAALILLVAGGLLLYLDRAGIPAGEANTQHRLVLRKCFLRDERAWQVQLTTRPSRVATERADVCERLADFELGQGFAESRHS